MCWISRRAKAAREIEWVVTEREAEQRTQTFMATLTVRHAAHHSTQLARDVRTCWRAMLQQRRWRTWAKAHRMEWICAEEITRGENGWHPHLHVLLLPGEDIEDYLVDAGDWYETWAAIVSKRLGAEHVPDPWVGLDLRPCDASTYITKLGLELTDKNAIKGKAPLALLEAGELDRYVELQIQRTRARDLTFSRGLKSYRETMPGSEPPAELLQARGSEWGRLRHLDPLAPLDVAEHSHSPEEARFMLDWWLNNGPAMRAARVADLGAVLPVAAE